MTASSRRSTLKIIRRNPSQEKNGSQIFLEKRRLKTSIGLLLQQRLQGAQKPKPKTYDFSSDTASADAFAAQFENARSGNRQWFVPSQNTPPKTSETIRPNSDVLCFVEKKGRRVERRSISGTENTDTRLGMDRIVTNPSNAPDALPLF